METYLLCHERCKGYSVLLEEQQSLATSALRNKRQQEATPSCKLIPWPCFRLLQLALFKKMCMQFKEFFTSGTTFKKEYGYNSTRFGFL